MSPYFRAGLYYRMKKIGIIGSGQVAQVLGEGFLKHGYDVMLGSRDTGKAKEWATKAGGKAQSGTFADAAKFGEILILSVKGSIAVEALKLAGIENCNDKTVIDVNNPIADAPPVNGVLQYFTNQNDSLMEQLQKAAPSANFVKSWSCVGNAFMVNPDFPGGKPTMFICGNSDPAKSQVNEILIQFGWEVEDLGNVEAARAIEPLCILWCIPGMSGKGWNHAFKLLRK